jgi:hypothetical protein
VRDIKQAGHLRMRVLALLLVACAARACPVTTHLSCPQVYAALRSRVQCVGSDCPDSVDPSACAHHPLMRRLLNWSPGSGLPTLDPASGGVLWNATCPATANMLVLALVGRSFVATQATDAVFFEFNTGTHTLNLKSFACEFQKPLYVVVILSALLTLTFLLFSNYLREHQAPDAKPGLASGGLAATLDFRPP